MSAAIKTGEAESSPSRRKVKPTPSILRSTVKVLVAAIVVLTIVYFGIGTYMADKLSRPDRKSLITTPAALGLKYEDVDFLSAFDGIPLKGWLLDSPGTKTIVMMHGRNGIRNDGEIGMMDLAKGLVQRGYDVLTFDFRAHGESGGVRYSLGQDEVNDVAGALGFLRKRGVNEVGTIGFSMGAATELLAAPSYPEMRAIVADSPYADLSALLDVQLPKASGLPGLFNPGVILMANTILAVDLTNIKPERAMAGLGNRPLLLIHGTSDEVVPIDHAYALQSAGADNPKLETWIVPGSLHVRSYKDHPDEYLSRVASFFDRNLR